MLKKPRLLAIVALLGAVGAFAFGLIPIIAFHRHRLALPRRLRQITAFTGVESVGQGEALPIHHSSDIDVDARLYRLGLTLEDQRVTVALPRIVQPAVYSPYNGLEWPVTKTVDTSAIRSGYYYFYIVPAGTLREDEVLRSGPSADREHSEILPFLVRPNKPAEVAVVASTNTWQAYNDFGGRSYYQDRITNRRYVALRSWLPVETWAGYGSSYPYSRPYALRDELRGVTNPNTAHDSHLMRAEWQIVSFLERHRIDYGVFSDRDFASDPLILQAKLIIFGVHTEYWSPEMIARLQDYVRGGGKVAFLSGNNIYREVQFEYRALQIIGPTPPHEVRRLIG